jgi:hypothetical protein
MKIHMKKQQFRSRHYPHLVNPPHHGVRAQHASMMLFLENPITMALRLGLGARRQRTGEGRPRGLRARAKNRQKKRRGPEDRTVAARHRREWLGVGVGDGRDEEDHTCDPIRSIWVSREREDSSNRNNFISRVLFFWYIFQCGRRKSFSAGVVF